MGDYTREVLERAIRSADEEALQRRMAERERLRRQILDDQKTGAKRDKPKPKKPR